MSAAANVENGWNWDQVNNRLSYNYRGTEAGYVSATAFNRATSFAITGSLSVTGAITAGSSVAATTTITAGTGLTVTTGNSTNSAGDERITAGNLRLGAVETFANTQPTSAAVMKTGTAPAGAITTSGGVFSSATVVRKIIADGTVSNVQT